MAPRAEGDMRGRPSEKYSPRWQLTLLRGVWVAYVLIKLESKQSRVALFSTFFYSYSFPLEDCNLSMQNVRPCEYQEGPEIYTDQYGCKAESSALHCYDPCNFPKEQPVSCHSDQHASRVPGHWKSNVKVPRMPACCPDVEKQVCRKMRQQPTE